MKKTALLLAAILVSMLLMAAVLTTLDDFFMPGSQPGQSGNLEQPGKCDNCHGGYDQAAEPAFNWRGSMMAQAMRDPLFLACLAIANQDAPESGDLCIRCHAPDGWLNGRSTPTDGSALNNNDREGVQCDFCHKLVKPSDIGINPYPGDNIYTSNTYASDQEYLGTLTLIPPQSGNGMYVAHSSNAKRGPFVDAAAKHQMHYSPFHSESDICGTCHDVSSPVFAGDGSLVAGAAKTRTNFMTHNMLPIERTFSEWKKSAFANGGVAIAGIGGNKSVVSTCQDCHMRDVSGYGANKRGIPYRDDLPLHDMTGGNTFIPDLVAQLFPDEVNIDALNAGKKRAHFMLQNAAQLNVSIAPAGDGHQATVKVTNQTGHKLPSGYPEGRRIWIQLQAYDSSGDLLYESGAYDPETAELTIPGTKIYEIKLGMTSDVALAAGIEGLPETGESFHFVLNNKVVKDNRIPPRGFTNAAFNEIQSPVVGYNYADGAYYDETVYPVPAGTHRVEARLLYQTVSKEYVEFLKNENRTNNAGDVMYNLWAANGKSAPVVMNEVIKYIQGNTPPVAAFTATPESGQAPLTVQFTNTSTNADSYSWNFGDDTSSSEPSPAHEFTNPGNYTVTLTASSGAEISTASKTITVTETPATLLAQVESVIFTRKVDPKGSKDYVTATVYVTDAAGAAVAGAEVFANFTGETSESVSGITNNAGEVAFDSRSVKNPGTGWCLVVTDIVKQGYTYPGPAEWCELGVKGAIVAEDDNQGLSLKVYPNPFINEINFEFKAQVDNKAQLTIYDNTGRLLKTIFNATVKKDVVYTVKYNPGASPDGIYLYRMQIGDKIYNGKLVHQR